MSREAFEAVINAITDAPVDVADAGWDESEWGLLQEASAYLKNNPNALRGGLEREFTYSHPVLALAAAYYHAARNAPVGTAGEGEELSNAAILKWAGVAVRAFLNRDQTGLQELAARTPTKTEQIVTDVAHIAVVGDAGYRGLAQRKVLRMIEKLHKKKPFDRIIHLGDTYFAGSEKEMLRHFLAPFMKLGIPVSTLCGNHDLYYGSAGYRFALDILGQPGRYFLIETPHWRIACLDTALACEGWRRNDGRLDEAQLAWLTKEIDKDDTRPLILMSHHYIISNWEKPTETLAAQLGGLVKDEVFAWYWGHEHHCAYYDRVPHGFYGVCVGNGAYMEAWESVKLLQQPQPSWCASEGCSCHGKKGKHCWPHGFLELELGPEDVVETYHNEGAKAHIRPLLRPANSTDRAVAAL